MHELATDAGTPIKHNGEFIKVIPENIYNDMNILAFFVLLCGIAISACGAYFSIVGLKMLFVGFLVYLSR